MMRSLDRWYRKNHSSEISVCFLHNITEVQSCRHNAVFMEKTILDFLTQNTLTLEVGG